MNELVSVIIPVYNVEEYLEECLESLINQTYKNIEIILVDDGSKDKSGDICDEYAKKDKRIHVIHKENGGVSMARNVGLDIAKGVYITFLDSDDYMFETGIETLVDLCKNNDSEIAIGGVQDIENEHKIRKSRPITNNFNKENAIKNFLDEKYFQCVIWAKIYRKEIIGEERFEEHLTIAEDFEFLYRVLKRVNKVTIDTIQMTNYYRIRSGSLMRQKYNSKFENEIKLAENVLKDVEKDFPKIKDSAIRRYQRIIISCIGKYFKENNEIIGVKHLVEKLREYPLKIELTLRIKIFLLLHAGWAFKLVFNMLSRIRGV